MLQKTRPYHQESDRRGLIPGAGGFTLHMLSPPITTTQTAPEPISSPVTSPPGPIYSACPMVNPVTYSGSADDCNGFFLQCSLALKMQLHRSPAEKAKISFIMSLLTGRAPQWAESMWKQNGLVTQSLYAFIADFHEVFGRPVGDASVCKQLYQEKEKPQCSPFSHSSSLKWLEQAPPVNNLATRTRALSAVPYLCLW